MNSKPVHAAAEVCWYDPHKSGKVMPPQGADWFAANGRLKTAGQADLFSVVLLFNPDSSVEKNCPPVVSLHFLAPDLVLPKLTTGSELFITQGPEILGEARIISITNR